MNKLFRIDLKPWNLVAGVIALDKEEAMRLFEQSNGKSNGRVYFFKTKQFSRLTKPEICLSSS